MTSPIFKKENYFTWQFKIANDGWRAAVAELGVGKELIAQPSPVDASASLTWRLQSLSLDLW